MSLRLSDEEKERLESHVKRLRAKSPAIQYTITDAIRDAIDKGLREVERAR